jgi:transposase InsO family protein
MLRLLKGGGPMPWQEQSIMSQKQEFVQLAATATIPFRTLCRRFGISPTTGYKWCARYQAAGLDGLAEHSRRPQRSPHQTPAAMEAQILSLRATYPTWGGRKLRRRLLDLGQTQVPSASTITAILTRHGLVPGPAAPAPAWQRFEHAAPNDLWQLDFKRPVPVATGNCHPLSVLDDHSRYAIGLIASGDQRFETIQQHLTHLFRGYGLPAAILTDNGPPWGVPHAPERLTRLGVWWIRLGILPLHGRIYHPQTQGKVERFHRTLQAEWLQFQSASDLVGWQTGFDQWRAVYNLERPHLALDLATPASRYQVSPRSFPEVLPALEYGPDDQVRVVHGGGQIRYRGQTYYVSSAILGERVALRPTALDGVLDIVYGPLTLRQLDLRAPPTDA